MEQLSAISLQLSVKAEAGYSGFGSLGHHGSARAEIDTTEVTEYTEESKRFY
jgi:hypothetical protein